MAKRYAHLATMFSVALALSYGPLAREGYAGENEDLSAQLNAAVQKTSGTTYELKYKFTADQRVEYKVEHLVTVETTIEDNRQRARSRSVSTKQWDFEDVSEQGLATFVHQVADAQMWQQIIRYVTEDGKQVAKEKEVRWDSRSEGKPPLHYEKVASAVGVPLAKVVIDQSGKLIRRSDKISGSSWGGQLVVPLPPEPVAVGGKWYKPKDIIVKLKDGRVKRIKTRQQYELKSVEDDVAIIDFNTQILTPGIREQPKVMVQIVQRLTAGTIEFDIDAGRVRRQRLHLDETIIGFNGAKSIMNYSGRFNEELIETEEIAKTAAR